MLVLLVVLAAWLVGGLLGADILARLWPGDDVRAAGSGNPGASNALRVRGKRFAALVLLWDAGKAALFLLLLAVLQLRIEFPNAENLPALCGLALVAGHLWPPFKRFNGGKGVATALGVLAVLLPSLLPWLLAVWLLLFLSTGYSGLASAAAALVLPMWAMATGDLASGKPLMAFCLMLAALILGAHRQNLQRLLRGEENRYKLPWLS